MPTARKCRASPMISATAIPALSYSMLLAADAAGGLARRHRAGRRQPSAAEHADRDRAGDAVVLRARRLFAGDQLSAGARRCCSPRAFCELSFNAMAQTLVQLNAPPTMRGRVIGLFNMASLGLRAFSGVSVGLLGSLIGVHWSLALSALAMLAIAAGLVLLPLAGQRITPPGLRRGSAALRLAGFRLRRTARRRAP